MFSVLPADRSKSTRIDGLGDKAIFCPNETGMAMLHVLKGDILITIGIHGLPADTVLDSEKSMAPKILANLSSGWLGPRGAGRLVCLGPEDACGLRNSQ